MEFHAVIVVTLATGGQLPHDIDERDPSLHYIKRNMIACYALSTLRSPRHTNVIFGKVKTNISVIFNVSLTFNSVHFCF